MHAQRRHDHIDLAHARSVGIAVGNVCYSPNSVTDHTLMLMLIAVRSATAMLRRRLAGARLGWLELAEPPPGTMTRGSEVVSVVAARVADAALALFQYGESAAGEDRATL